MKNYHFISFQHLKHRLSFAIDTQLLLDQIAPTVFPQFH